MGQSLSSVTDMVSYAGDLRRFARQAEPDVAAKIQQSANLLEKSAIAQVSDAGPQIGKLLDTFA